MVPRSRRLIKTGCFVLVLLLCLQGIVIMIYLSTTRHRWREHVTDARSMIQSHVHRNYVTTNVTQHGGAKTHIGFLKVHKAASTTVQRIFLRFGWKRNLTYVLPREYNPFAFPNIISLTESLTMSNTVAAPANKTFDLLCHHVVYNTTAWSDFLPSDFVTIGTVREPYALFMSMVNYMSPRYITNIVSDDPVLTYLRDPYKYEPPHPGTSFTNNRLAFEYGLHPDIIVGRHMNAFDNYLKHLDKKFILVVVTERLDESLVLMRRYLNMSMEDILYSKLNVYRNNRNLSDPQKQELFRNFAIFDYALYEFFVRKLHKQIESEGNSFEDEVVKFKAIRLHVERFCHGVKTTQSVTIEKSLWNQQFDVTQLDCTLMHMDEIMFTQNIRKRQYGNATWDWSHKYRES